MYVWVLFHVFYFFVGYGDILMPRDPLGARIALFFTIHIGMFLVGLGVGASANAILQCLSNEPKTGKPDTLLRASSTFRLQTF